MAISNIKDIVESELEGRSRIYTWRKTPALATSSNVWFDISMSSGNPKAKQWFDATPLAAQQVKRSTDGGLFHGADVAPSTKYLRLLQTRSNSATGIPMDIILCDYLLYYPTIDMSETAEQEMDNTATLPRYTDGAGVQMMAVLTAGGVGGEYFQVRYTNQDGVAGRLTPLIRQGTSTVNGTIVHGAPTTANMTGPFMPLQEGDTGVRSIQGVTQQVADTGLFSIILVKPLLQTQIRELNTPYEKDPFIQSGILPEIQDDAFLSFVCLPTASLNGVVLFGDIKVIWN